MPCSAQSCSAAPLLHRFSRPQGAPATVAGPARPWLARRDLYHGKPLRSDPGTPLNQVADHKARAAARTSTTIARRIRPCQYSMLHVRGVSTLADYFRDASTSTGTSTAPNLVGLRGRNGSKPRVAFAFEPVKLWSRIELAQRRRLLPISYSRDSG